VTMNMPGFGCLGESVKIMVYGMDDFWEFMQVTHLH
jgi:hypothetical protein